MSDDLIRDLVDLLKECGAVPRFWVCPRGCWGRVFHTTHRILERAEANFDGDHHEQAAYLHGWLMERVWRIVCA